MTQTFLLTLLSFSLGFIAFYALKKLRHTQDSLVLKNKELEKRLYELSVSQVIANQIGYSLNIKTIIESVLETIEHVIEHSAVSYALVEENIITVKIFEKDFVGPNFIQGMKESMLNTLYEALPTEKFQVIESVHKEFLNKSGEYNNDKPNSTFTTLIKINNVTLGAISVSSTKKNAFMEEDKSLLERIVENTTSAIGNLEKVINTEKGKLDSFLFSLTSGAILILLNNGQMKLSAINTAAKQFLHLTNEIDTTSVIAHFGMHYDLVRDINEVAIKKESILLKNVNIYDRYFKIYLNPVFLHNSDIVLGVSITMEDITYERDLEEVRETFTNMVVHELRAPLTSIKGASSMLLNGKLSANDTTKMLHIINESTERMLMDIGDVLDVAKLEAGKFSLNEIMSDVNKIISDKALAFSFAASERNINIKTQLETSIPQTAFDPQRIGQVVNNLISNALKFTPDNGTITLTTTKQNGIIEVKVTDTGMGVPPEKMALLFSKYGQLGGSVRHEGGTGLGLYISKGIIESHGGKIWLESKKDKGTTVTFTLPIVTKIENKNESTLLKPVIKNTNERVVN